ncbi:efflux RND transporter permease subunit [Methylocystis bryophila]|uniref:efflux RND transporter permease subunit n=1 Tax=Methylocystis bryophila TaxID=655015 RepID=UPI001FD95F52|nr:efflux RND transporter permease subunit [Methylocystis bryophila]
MKNAIMMIEVVLHFERDAGPSSQESIHCARLLRFRPSMMPTFAAFFGALALGAG